MNEVQRRFYEFGEWRLNAEAGFLSHRGEPVNLPPKSIELLTLLVEKCGEVATKQEIWDRVWRDAFVEETNLTHNIYLLRKAFRDSDGGNPIQTVPRRGYRFTDEVRLVEEPAELVIERRSVTRVVIEETDDGRPVRRALGLRKLVFAAVLVGLVAIGIAAIGLRSLSSGGSGKEIRSIAVLPMRQIGDDERTRLFPLGLTDSLITALGRSDVFSVRPFSSVEKYAEGGDDALAAGKKLGVDAVLEGTVQQVDERIRVNLRLVRVSDGEQVWNYSFTGASGDLLSLQSSLAKAVSEGLRKELGVEVPEPARAGLTASNEAYVLYLTGRELWLKRNGDKALEYYRQAIAIDQEFAAAYLGIADQLAFHGPSRFREAEEALNKAIELDPTLHEAHATRGFLLMFNRWDWTGAERSLIEAIRLAPNSSKAHHWYGVFLSLQARFDGALREMEIASALDPTSFVIRNDIAEVHYFRRDYSRAAEVLEPVLAADPSVVPGKYVLEAKIRYKAGSSYYREQLRMLIGYFERDSNLAGREADDLAVMKRLLENGTEEEVSGYVKDHYARVASDRATLDWGKAVMGAVDRDNRTSMAALREALESRNFMIPFAAVDPLFDPVRTDPEFREIIRGIGLGG